ncbi:MAG: immunoglobulin domain-containing protein [Phycisphaerales bacterium]|nr:immunoglobulin domain-containing protein [Phycisphaerales bacterium]
MRAIRFIRDVRNVLPLCAAACLFEAATADDLSTQNPNSRFQPVPITLDRVTRLYVTSTGQVFEEEGGVAGGECQRISAHTDASFSGGSYVVQAGFAESEIAACSYIVPAGDFPLQLDLCEMIFATSSATQNTVTQWSILVWEGTPQTGTLIFSFASDDVIIPHIRLGTGTTGVNVQFSIDPGDPEQIIINNNGSNTFSIGYRIDEHNNQSQNPCVVSPPTCCNAFPTTDVSGLASPTNNWLFGVNCGPFGCPANGGWARFSTLPGFCRPSGDWVMRATWHPINCQPGVGACCKTDGTCEILLQDGCNLIGGTYRGDGSTCETANCPQPTGACCFAETGGCVDLTEEVCGLAGGVYRGNGTACATTPVCFPRGACCLPSGACLNDQTPEDCTAAGGTFQGHQTNCTTTNCPQPTGRCCLSNGFCLTLTNANCNAAGGSWGGFGTNCGEILLTQQPASAARCAGQSVTFSVRACANATPTYQWRRNGVNIPGATTRDYTIASVNATHAGSYDVVVTTPGDSETSNTAMLAVSQSCDSNCDGTVNNFDIDAFVLALTGGQAAWSVQYPCDFFCANDVNRDTRVDNFDIDAFVACLTGG